MIDPFDYDSARRFLVDWVRRKEEATPGWRRRDLAGAMGCSPSHLANVLSGQRRLAPRFVPGLLAALALGPDHTEQLSLLIALEQAEPDSPAAARVARWIQDARCRRAADGPPEAGAAGQVSLSNLGEPLVEIVALAARCPGFDADPAALAACIFPRPAPAAVVDAQQRLRRGPRARRRGRSLLTLRAASARARQGLRSGPLEEMTFLGSFWSLPIGWWPRAAAVVERAVARLDALLAAPHADPDDRVVEVLITLLRVSRPIAPAE